MGASYDFWPGGFTATMDVTLTQANAAGGAMVLEISPGGGNEFFVMSARATNSGTNGVLMVVETGTGGTTIQAYGSVASAAGTTGYLGGTTNGSLSAGSFTNLGVLVSGSQAFRLAQTVAGAQNDTFRVLINIRCRGALPQTLSFANSTNPGNVTVTAGALSFVGV